VPAAFEPVGPAPRSAAGGGLRFWSIRHARGLSAFYRAFERALSLLRPLVARIGPERIEKPVTFVERKVKEVLFDCRMCGKCMLSSSGLSCPMNCPKGLRNGPCGGVRADGNCEVYAEMPCVWVKAWEGAARMPYGRDAIAAVQPPVDHRLKGRSSWMSILRGENRGAGGSVS
jgi:hypothetical protein